MTEADELSQPTGDDSERSSDDGDPRGLWNRFHRPLLILGMRHLGSRADAEDMAQEALHRVTKALGENRVRELRALPGFVLQTARHICQQWLRKRGREHRALQGYGQESDDSSSTVQPLTDLIDEERRVVVRRALQLLPAEDRQLLEHLYVLDTDPNDLAQRLQITPGALRVRKHRILKRLAASLGESGSATDSALREL